MRPKEEKKKGGRGETKIKQIQHAVLLDFTCKIFQSNVHISIKVGK